MMTSAKRLESSPLWIVRAGYRTSRSPWAPNKTRRETSRHKTDRLSVATLTFHPVDREELPVC